MYKEKMNDGQLKELMKQDGGLSKLEIRKIADSREGKAAIACFATEEESSIQDKTIQDQWLKSTQGKKAT